jgi:peptide/nickel transport system permease protein
MNTAYIIQRLLLSVVVILGITVLVFLIIQFVPGDPARVSLGVAATEENVEALRERLGLNRSLPEQYVSWLAGDDWFATETRIVDGEEVQVSGSNKGILRGDFGDSLITRQSIGPQLVDRLPATLQLAGMSMFIGLLIAFPLGVISATNPGGIFDIVASLFSQIGVSIPDFWLGILLVLFFSLNFPIEDWRLPPSGYDPIGDGAWNWFQHIIMPATTAGLISASIQTRFIRSAMLEVMNQNYIRTARAKGLEEIVVVLRHGVRNALIPIVTIIGLQMTALLSSVVVVEIVFAWPGLGRLALDAVLDRDYPVVQGTVLIFATMVVFINLMVDMMYFFLDPRIEYA